MFYVKTQLSAETTLTSEITNENVFTRCPRCGSEITVDLVELFSNCGGDLVDMPLLCVDCSRKLYPELRREGP